MATKETLGCAAFQIYFGIGLVQLLAIIQRHSDVDTPALADLRAVISMFVAYIPLIGTVAGIKGAIDAWGWGFWSSVAFFFWHFVIYALAFAVGGVAALMSRRSGK